MVLMCKLNLCFSNRYADLGDIFSEVGDITTPSSAALSKLSRQIPTPTSGGSSIAIPRPPSRRSETAGNLNILFIMYFILN